MLIYLFTYLLLNRRPHDGSAKYRGIFHGYFQSLSIFPRYVLWLKIVGTIKHYF